MLEINSNPSIVLKICPSGILNYDWLDPKFWVRRQSQRYSHFGDDGLLVVGSYLDKFSPRWRIVEKSCMWHPNSIRHAKFQRATKQLKKKNEKLANLSNLPN